MQPSSNTPAAVELLYLPEGMEVTLTERTASNTNTNTNSNSNRGVTLTGQTASFTPSTRRGSQPRGPTSTRRTLARRLEKCRTPTIKLSKMSLPKKCASKNHAKSSEKKSGFASKFIVGARHFLSIQVRELVPEFYYLPEMFLNSNVFDLGEKQSGVKVSSRFLI